MFKIIAQFIISGSVVVLASYIAPKLGQKWAGLLVAMPLLTLLTFIALSLDARNGSLREYLLSSLVFMIPAALFIGCLLVFSSRLHFIANIALSMCVFAVVVIFMHKIKLV